MVDEDNLVGGTFGFKAVPNGLLIGAAGKVEGIIASGFDIRRSATRALVENWLASGPASPPGDEAELEWSEEALRLFRLAGAAVRRGDRATAVELLKKAVPLEPDNYIIRKQLWAIENPDRFYAGEIDYAWQRERLAAGP